MQTDSGIEHIDFERLPKDIQERFHYDPSKATVYRQQLAEAKKERAAEHMQPEISKKANSRASNEQELEAINAQIKSDEYALGLIQSMGGRPSRNPGSYDNLVKKLQQLYERKQQLLEEQKSR